MKDFAHATGVILTILGLTAMSGPPPPVSALWILAYYLICISVVIAGILLFLGKDGRQELAQMLRNRFIKR